MCSLSITCLRLVIGKVSDPHPASETDRLHFKLESLHLFLQHSSNILACPPDSFAEIDLSEMILSIYYDGQG